MGLPGFAAHFLIPGAAIVGIVFAISLWIKVSKIQVAGSSNDENREYLLEEQRGDAEVSPLAPCGGSHERLYCIGEYSWAWFAGSTSRRLVSRK
jgi:hypothetical protein